MKMPKTPNTSFKLSPTVRAILARGKQEFSKTHTTIVEEAVRQWAQREGVVVEAEQARQGEEN